MQIPLHIKRNSATILLNACQKTKANHTAISYAEGEEIVTSIIRQSGRLVTLQNTA